MIPFNSPCNTGLEEKYILDALKSGHLSGDGYYAKKCQTWFENELNCKKVLLTPSCTHALEMAAMLIDIQPNDEIIMPSYTFVSTANAFVLRGAKIVFIDIEPTTMNMDVNKIESAITERTKAIVPVHYAGVGCDMDAIKKIAQKHNLHVIEDAAQGMKSKYKNDVLGTVGDIGCYSFHETKNYTSGGEGGLLIINNEKFLERAEIIREKGTNRNQFFRGEVDKYSWVDIGSSYLPSELQSAYLWAQLENADKILERRLDLWNTYNESLKGLEQQGFIELQAIPDYAAHNGHIFFFKTENIEIRNNLLKFLKNNGIYAVFHYIPLHSSKAGIINGSFCGEDRYTTSESEKIVRLPLFYNMQDAQLQYVVDKINDFFLQ